MNDNKTTILYTDGSYSYLSRLRNKARIWGNITKEINKSTFHEYMSSLKLNENNVNRLWYIVAYCHYQLTDPVAFFEYLMEVAIEERVTFKSFATASDIRKWSLSVPTSFRDDILLFLYLAIRDDWNAYDEVLNGMDSLCL